MQATDFTRDDCLLGRRRITYKQLTRRYLCNNCGGRPVVRFGDGYYAACGDCGGQDFVSERTFHEQVVDAWEVKQGLPEQLRALLDDDEPVPAGDALADLYG